MHSQSARRAPSTASFLRSAEVAAILQVSPKTIARWAQQGLLPYQRTLGGHRRYPSPPSASWPPPFTRRCAPRDRPPLQLLPHPCWVRIGR
jgi:excisionase family DNA binding protein